MSSSGSAKTPENEKCPAKDGIYGCIEKLKELIQKIGEAAGVGIPSAGVSAIHIPTLNLQEAHIVVDVHLNNPVSIHIPQIEINYLFESDKRKLVSGLISDAGTLNAHGSKTLKIPINLIYDDIKSKFSDIKPGSVIPYKIKVALVVDLPVIGRVSVPVEETGEIPIPHKPDIDLVQIKFEKFDIEETVATLHLKLENKHVFELSLNSIDYEVWIDNISIGGAQLEKSAKLEKEGTSYLELPVTFKPKDFGSALWEIISGKGTSYSMKGNICVDTPFGVMNLPFSKEGGTTQFKKISEEDEGADKN